VFFFWLLEAKKNTWHFELSAFAVLSVCGIASYVGTEVLDFGGA